MKNLDVQLPDSVSTAQSMFSKVKVDGLFCTCFVLQIKELSVKYLCNTGPLKNLSAKKNSTDHILKAVVVHATTVFTLKRDVPLLQPLLCLMQNPAAMKVSHKSYC